ncbi:Nup188-like protein [Euroglyphus maynei]|uniref:Nup188-like protein n=1 Tax=Euroglyphus maynei TaxID=6958 RepID=A0A1Y3BDP5_EURMA|nr:Nup188-like protein [Euroglyphus maynei]
MKNLWTLLSGSLNLKSLQFIADELQSNQKQLIEGVLYYRPHDANVDSTSKITEMKNTMVKPSILHNLSVLLDLNAQQCCDLIQSYLLYEFDGTPEMARTLFVNEKQVKKLFENLWNYYYSERIFSLFCLKQILSNWKDSDEHVYTKIFQDFIKHINPNGQMASKLTAQLKHLIRFHEKPRSKTVNFLSEKNSIHLSINIRKEEIEVLQLLLLYYRNFEPTAEDVLNILKCFHETGFDSTNYCGAPQIQSLDQFCGFLKTILIVEFLDPNGLRKCQVNDVEHHLFRSENLATIREIHRIIVNLNSTAQEHSLLFFSWTIINLFCSINDNQDQQDVMERLGNNALQLKIFRYIESCLLLAPMDDLLKRSSVHGLIYEIIGNLLEVTFTVFDFEKFIHNDNSLIQLLIHLFGNDVIARIVFDSGLATGLGLSLVRYNDVAMDGWKILYCRLKSLINQIKQGHMYSAINDEVILNEISKLAFICSQLIAHHSHSNIAYFKRIVKLLLDLFKLIVSADHQTSIRLFMAAIIKLCSELMRQNLMDEQAIWSTLNDKRFFPYMIGFANQFNEILTGTDTNISTLGYILASEEFIKGNYELTMSFLSLMTHLVKGKEEFHQDNSIIASFMFIINDIFPSYKLWNFRKENDAHRIGRMCIEIFHHLINRVRRKKANELIMIEKICIIRLMEGQAAEQLLTIIKRGEEIVKRKILNSGNEYLLEVDDEIVSIRTSISILSHLLEMYSEVTKLSSLKDKSVIENIIFSSTNNNNPNMLLIFSHFICQKYDIYLAINALQLINQLAFKFPMSMLACFGSHTEFIRDHFLFRLETVTEDINFKIALLNFLSTCVEYQPGLVEMFLNVANDNHQQTSVLNSIIEILEEKWEGQFHCPYELHHASLQFVAKFWLKPNIMAMNKLKKNDKFWMLVTFPLFDRQIDNPLCGFILKILSREIHFTKILEKTDVCHNLEKLLDDMIEKNVIINFSHHIHRTLMLDDNDGRSWTEDFINFVDGWRDFLCSWAKFIVIGKTGLISILQDVIKDILQYVSILIDNGQPIISQKANKLINKFSTLLLIITSNNEQLEKAKLNDIERLMEIMTEIFGKIVAHKESISFNSQISLGVFLIKLITERSNDDHQQDHELFGSVVELLNNSFRLMAKQLNGDVKSNLNLEKRLILVNLSIIMAMFQRSSKLEENRYLNILRYFATSEQIVNMLIFFLLKRIHLDLAQNIAPYFVVLSHSSDGASLLNALNLVNQISVNFSLPAIGLIDKMNDSHFKHDISIFSQIVRTVNNMIIHLRHHFTETCVSFIAIYLDTFREIFAAFRKQPNIRIIRLVLLILELCSSTSNYVRIWQNNHHISFKAITEEILLSSNMMVAFLLRPSLVMKTFLEDYDTKSNRENDAYDALQNLMIQMLLESMKFLLNVSPGLLELFANESAINDEKYELLISTNFSFPNVDSNEILTFGSLANLINFLIKLEKDGKRIGMADDDCQLQISLLELSFFHKRKDSFEWYGNYEEIKTILLQYLKPSDNFLVIGCGNSTLSVDLFDDGYENNTSIDISEIVINKMISKYKSNGIREKLQFECMDIMQMRYANESFNIVLDKGTLDAICSDNVDIDKIFTQISRVLKYFGRYICVSLLQEHVLEKLLSWFTANQNWICRIEMIRRQPNETSNVDVVNFPVFIVTCLKMKTKLPETYVEMGMSGDRKFRKIHDMSEAATIIKSYQRMEFLKYMVRNGKIDDEDFNIELFDDSNNNDCRYRFYFVQKCNIIKSTNLVRCSIFIVPQGREHEWLFSTGKGRMELLSQCRCDRLAVVFLSRKHHYENMENIKNELANQLQGFFPHSSEKILFLSIGDGDIGERNIVWEGESEFNGQMFVEDVCIDRTMYRRLVFAHNHNIIQSEARLKKQSKQGTFRCDQNFLSCDHHQYIGAGLAIINRPFKSVYNLLMIGLGGGCFISFLANNLKPSDDIILRVTVVEIDPLLEQVAKEYFDFAQKTASKIPINVIIDDGLHYLRSKSQENEKFDFIIFDVDSKNMELGISCPPPEFVEYECLNQVQSLLTDDGFFILNLVARNEDLKQNIYERLRNLFHHRFRCKVNKDVNEVVFATNVERLEWLRNDWNSNSRYDYIRKSRFHIDLLAETYRQMCSKLSFC